MAAGNLGLRVNAADMSAVWSMEGYEWEFVTTFEMGVGDVKYFSFEVAASAEVFIALQKRQFKADESDVDLRILWDTTFSGGTAVDTFNSHNYLGLTSAVEVYEDPTVTNITTVREEDFLPSGGSLGSQGSSGELSPETGFRIYRASENFVVEITNVTNSSNTVMLGYKWAELPISNLE